MKADFFRILNIATVITFAVLVIGMTYILSQTNASKYGEILILDAFILVNVAFTRFIGGFFLNLILKK